MLNLIMVVCLLKKLVEIKALPTLFLKVCTSFYNTSSDNLPSYAMRTRFGGNCKEFGVRFRVSGVRLLNRKR